VCRDADSARARFGTADAETGAVYSRTGRAFFPDFKTTEAVLSRVRRAMDSTGFWDALESDWAVLDAEIMPWSAKAQSLIRGQYAPVGAAAGLALGAVSDAYAAAAARGVDMGSMLETVRDREARAARYADAYRRYCWPVASLDDYRIAPFHLLASEGAVHMDKDNRWHMETLAGLAATDDPVMMATPYRVVPLADADAVEAATTWWTELTAAGGEGIVVKPLDFVSRGPKGLVQPALKCRGREYLRIIYGPDYDAPEHLSRLRRRGTGRKRGLAAREFALGYEALHRFVERAPLRQVHECVFGVLALESEPVDPRL